MKVKGVYKGEVEVLDIKIIYFVKCIDYSVIDYHIALYLLYIEVEVSHITCP